MIPPYLGPLASRYIQVMKLATLATHQTLHTRKEQTQLVSEIQRLYQEVKKERSDYALGFEPGLAKDLANINDLLRDTLGTLYTYRGSPLGGPLIRDSKVSAQLSETLKGTAAKIKGAGLQALSDRDPVEEKTCILNFCKGLEETTEKMLTAAPGSLSEVSAALQSSWSTFIGTVQGTELRQKIAERIETANLLSFHREFKTTEEYIENVVNTAVELATRCISAVSESANRAAPEKEQSVEASLDALNLETGGGRATGAKDRSPTIEGLDLAVDEEQVRKTQKEQRRLIDTIRTTLQLPFAFLTNLIRAVLHAVTVTLRPESRRSQSAPDLRAEALQDAPQEPGLRKTRSAPDLGASQEVIPDFLQLHEQCAPVRTQPQGPESQEPLYAEIEHAPSSLAQKTTEEGKEKTQPKGEPVYAQIKRSSPPTPLERGSSLQTQPKRESESRPRIQSQPATLAVNQMRLQTAFEKISGKGPEQAAVQTVTQQRPEPEQKRDPGAKPKVPPKPKDLGKKLENLGITPRSQQEGGREAAAQREEGAARPPAPQINPEMLKSALAGLKSVQQAPGEAPGTPPPGKGPSTGASR